ncbi:MAG: GTPase Era [Gammaproteobacteria bacterium]|nr:GTPase Era [Gammaproteobacteria bacterium]
MAIDGKRFGYVALAGSPNVGKSTLLNKLVGEKISITSRRPQTTRHRILGVKTESDYQIVFVDTPGIHPSQGRRLNRIIVKTAISSLADVDLVLLLIDQRAWSGEQEWVLEQVTQNRIPVMLLINKIDRIRDKRTLLPLIEESRQRHPFVEIVPVSSRFSSAEDLRRISETIAKHLPVGPPGFPADQRTDRNDKFRATELIREQLFSVLGQELPYSTAVEIEKYEENDKQVLRIEAIVWVEKEGQKSIVVGKNGQMLKMIGMNARKQIEMTIHHKVFLGLWVKVRKGWSDSARQLHALGYTES